MAAVQKAGIKTDLTVDDDTDIQEIEGSAEADGDMKRMNSTAHNDEIEVPCSVNSTEMIPFTIDEDKCLRRGIKKFGWNKWLQIVNYRLYRFNPYRTGESLQRRADKLNMRKNLKL